MAAPDAQGHRQRDQGAGMVPGAWVCLPAAGAGQDGFWGAPGEVGCGVLCSGVARPHKTQSRQPQALSAKKQCSKNVLNPQTQTRFACRKLQGRFRKEFATRKVVTGWMLNIWGGDIQVQSEGMLSWSWVARDCRK